VKFDFLGPDNFAVRTSVLKLELHVFAEVGAELRRRRFGDRIGLDFGFESRERERQRSQDKRSSYSEHNSFHGFTPFWLLNVIAEQWRPAFPSNSTGENRENMSRFFFYFSVL
jgi:hypothetical protein